MDTAGLLQLGAKDKRTKGGVMIWTLLVYYNRVKGQAYKQRTMFQNKSKLFELSLIFKSNPWHDLMNVCFLRVILPYI